MTKRELLRRRCPGRMVTGGPAATVYSPLMTGNRPELPGCYRELEIVNPVVAQREQAITGIVRINLRYNGWNITDPVAMSREAHKVCAMLQRGAAPGDVNNKLVAEVGIALNMAQQFTSTAMSTYPDCP